MDSKLLNTVSTILTGNPVKILDDESHSIIENELWELVHPRTQGEYASTRVIGSANIALAFNIVRQSIILDSIKYTDSSNSLERCAEEFAAALYELQQQRIIRKKPQKLRSSFKLVRKI